jgi:programmed cell death protein 5
MLAQILTPEAADRLGRIRLVKASRADDVENRLIMLARSGQLRQKITEEQLKDILNGLSEQEQAKEIVVRKTGGRWDDDDLEDLLDM